MRSKVVKGNTPHRYVDTLNIELTRIPSGVFWEEKNNVPCRNGQPGQNTINLSSTELAQYRER